MDRLWQDVRYALRLAARNPGTTLLVLLTLTLGIGVNTAMFSVVNGVLLRPLPYSDPDRLVRIYESNLARGWTYFTFSPPNFRDFRDQNRTLSAMAAYNTGSSTYTAGGVPERLAYANVSYNLMQILGVSPALGRDFLPEEDQPGNDAVIIVSHDFWRSRMAGDPDVIGRSMTLGGKTLNIIGVMPEGFYFPSPSTDYWTPIALPADGGAPRGAHFLSVVGRLRDGVSFEEAETELTTIAARLAAEYPATNKDYGTKVLALHEQVTGDVRPALLVLAAAVGCVVLIACVNVANVLLARAAGRVREMATRAALGAGGTRLLRQVLTESIMLSGLGGILGLLLARWCIPILLVLSGGAIPRQGEVTVDASALLFTLTLSVVVGILFGLLPAWYSRRPDLNELLGQGTRQVGSRRHGLQHALVIAETALALMLVIGAALLLRSLSKLHDVSPGFNADQVLTFSVSLPRPDYPEEQQRRDFYRNLMDRLEALPGVEAAGATHVLPMSGTYFLNFSVVGQAPVGPGDSPSAGYRTATPNYFRALQIPLLRGRLFMPGDTDQAPGVALVSEGFVRRFFPDQEALGKQLRIGNGIDTIPHYEIVGVVGDIKHDGLDADELPLMYVPAAQDVFSGMSVAVRHAGDAGGLINDVRAQVLALDNQLPIYRVRTLREVVDDSLGQRRFAMQLLSIFAGVALLLAAGGIYGVVSYRVNGRLGEMGLRMALGAGRGDILRLVVGREFVVLLIGLALGLGAALGLTRFLESMLFEVSPADPVVFAGAAAALSLVGLAAAYVPARRAAAIDPARALRHD